MFLLILGFGTPLYLWERGSANRFAIAGLCLRRDALSSRHDPPHHHPARHARGHRPRRRVDPRGTAGGVPDRNGVRAGRRRHRRPRRRGDLRGQAPPHLQSADRPRRRPGHGRAAGRVRRPRARRRRPLLAGGPDAGVAAERGLAGIAAGHRRPRHPGGARSRPSRGPRPARRGTHTDRRAQRQSLRPHQPHRGGACRGHARPRPRSRWRPLPHRHQIDDHRPVGAAGGDPATGRRGPRGPRVGARAARQRRQRRTADRARPVGKPLRPRPARPPERDRGAPRRGSSRFRSGSGGRPQFEPRRRSGRGGGQPVCHAARPRPSRLRRHRGDADSRSRLGRRDQRPAAPRRRPRPMSAAAEGAAE